MPKDEKLNEKLDEIIGQKKEADEANGDPLPLPICISLGCSLGLMIGVFMDRLSIGLCIGPAVGCALYGIVTLFQRRKKKEKPNPQEDETAEDD